MSPICATERRADVFIRSRLASPRGIRLIRHGRYAIAELFSDYLKPSRNRQLACALHHLAQGTV
jgi:hypothetical protein